MRPFARLCLIPLLAIWAGPALAAWPNNPILNLPVVTAPGNQRNPTSVSDGAGGVIIAYQDNRGGNFDIYTQHVRVTGVVDPAWPANGRLLCGAAGDQTLPTIAPDGAGGAIVTWQDLRGGSTLDIYAQHVLASGAVDPAWPVDGRGLATTGFDESSPQIASDGAGGALVIWNIDLVARVFVQHVLATGAVDGAWPINGQQLVPAASGQLKPVLVSDGAGGAIVAWEDHRTSPFDIYAQHVLTTGLDPAWTTAGRKICGAAADQLTPSIASDGAGGAIVTWIDNRTSVSGDIYAQRVLGSGVVAGGWPTDGQAVCTAAQTQAAPVILADGTGGAIVAWQDNRNLTGNDIYAQHVLPWGAVDVGWPTDGRAVTTLAIPQTAPKLVSDGAGGAIVAWLGGAIFADHILASGALDAAWPVDGRQLGSGTPSTMVSDGAGGAIVAWEDGRNGGSANFDIYAQRVARDSYLGTPEAEIVSVTDVPADQGGKVKLSWNASYLQTDPYNLVTSYRIYRSVPPNVAAAAVVRTEDDFARPGELLTTSAAGTTYYWEYLATVATDFLTNYSYLAPTAEDSTATGAPTTAFMVQARTAGSQHWESWPVSGYSVDNLPPAAPQALTGQYAGGTTRLHWSPNIELDLAGYRLYRGASESFVPGPGNLLAALSDTGYVDAGGVPEYYKLTAVDSHGNESLVAVLSPSSTVDVGDAGPGVLAFALPAPNPATSRATLQYTLPRAGLVQLGVYTASGRLVRKLVSGVREAGEHAEAWDLRSAEGGSVGTGIYFVRLEAEGRLLVRRVAVTR